MVMCWAPDCKHYNVRDNCKMFRFPKSGKTRALWKRLLRRNEEPGPGAYICSCHFRDGKRENGPELFLHNAKRRAHFAPSLPMKAKKTKPESTIVSGELNASISSECIESEVNPSLPSTSGDIITNISDAQVQPSTSNASLEAEIYFLKQEKEEMLKKITYLTPRLSYENIQGNDKLIVVYTGLPNHTIFEALFNLIKDEKINYYLGWTVDKLTKVDQLLMCLMKLRLNTPHVDLAHRFSVSSSMVTNVTLTYIHVLCEVLFEQLNSNMPSRIKNKMCLPTSFSKFTNCRVVLDCTEIFTVTARKSMKTQRLTYSSYKHRNTFKGLIGVAPNGVITYVSNLYVGSTSDQKIVQDCGILNLLQPGDLVIADKGFLTGNLLPAGVSLNIPPFLRGPQFTPEQVKCTESIARARIHVERAIRRMKCYRILNLLPTSLCAYGDEIFKTVAAITNLQYPLIKEIDELFSADFE